MTIVFGVELRAQDAEWDLNYKCSLPSFTDGLRKAISGVIGYRVTDLEVATAIKSAPAISPVPFEFVNAPSPSSSASVAPSTQLLDTKSPLSLPVICVIGGGGALLLVGAFLTIHYRVQKYNKAMAIAHEQEMRDRIKRLDVSHNVRLATLQEAAKTKSRRQKKRPSAQSPASGTEASQRRVSGAVMPAASSPSAQRFDDEQEESPASRMLPTQTDSSPKLLSPIQLDVKTPR